jgi:hypothetical protein
LELCYKSLGMLEGDAPTNIELPVVPVEIQARAAKQASAAVLQEVRSFGTYGNRLHSFVLRIGSLFALSHGRSGQSEPETNHFSISGSPEVSQDDFLFLNEAVKWTVLFEEPETKKKGASEEQTVGFEYILNPIFAPYFNISYRKRRRLDISNAELHVIALGSYEQFTQLVKAFSKKWRIDLEETSPTLFSHLGE